METGEAAIVLIFIGVIALEVFLCVLCGRIPAPRFRRICRILAIPAVLAVFFVTILSRSPGVMTGTRLVPLWSYEKAVSGIRKGSAKYLRQIVLNILLFVPLGMLLPFTLRKPRPIHYALVFLAGTLLSLLVETLQYRLRLGVFDVDDLIDNSFGFLIGLAVTAACRKRIMKVHNDKEVDSDGL